MKKRKHYYNKKKFELEVPKNANPIEILRCIRTEKDKKEKIWLDFADNLYKDKERFLKEQDLGIILKLIYSKQTINKLIRYFYNIDYNPLIDKISLENMPEDMKNIIIKKQNYIKQFFYFEKEYENILIMFNKKDILEKIDKYDLVIGLCGEYTYFYSNNLPKYLEILNILEPNTWEIKKELTKYGIKEYIINWNKKTSLNFLDKNNIVSLSERM